MIFVYKKQGTPNNFIKTTFNSNITCSSIHLQKFGTNQDESSIMFEELKIFKKLNN